MDRIGRYDGHHSACRVGRGQNRCRGRANGHPELRRSPAATEPDSGRICPQEKEIRGIQSEAASLLERMQKDSEVMSDAEKRRLQQQIESLNNDFVYERNKLQKEIEARQQELFSGIDQRIQKAIQELVMSEDYDLIIPRQAALYVGDVYNITRKVTEKLNELDSAEQ
ncbi:MAG: OmpH family outer membrane protein [Gammaproteobacteria bacterium]|nr:OmpH family outer membrane protein [Gammaproteobacteria bacterium]